MSEVTKDDIKALERKIDNLLEKNTAIAVQLAGQEDIRRRVDNLEANQGKVVWAIVAGWLAAIGSFIFNKG